MDKESVVADFIDQRYSLRVPCCGTCGCEMYPEQNCDIAVRLNVSHKPPVNTNHGCTKDSHVQSNPESQTESSQAMLTQQDAECSLGDSQDNEPKPWARLISLSSTVPHKFLYKNDNTDANGKLNLYSLGRSTDNEFQFPFQIVSSRHCMIYCKRRDIHNDDINVDNSENLIVYLEDCSSNGTYLNNECVTKGLYKQLHTGDQISLIRPNTHALQTDSISQASFIIQILLPSYQPSLVPMIIPTNKHINTAVAISNTNNTNNTATVKTSNFRQSNTIIRLLDQNRDIKDFYIIQNRLGVGASGQVHINK